MKSKAIETNGKIRKKLRETCGGCVGLKREPILDKRPCSEMGILASQRSCSRYQPDVFAVQKMIEGEGSLLTLASMLRYVPTSKLEILGSIIAQDKRNRKNGMHLGQRVFVRYRGAANANYKSNFMVAYVLYANKRVIRLVSKRGDCVLTLELDDFELNGPSVYSAKNFRPILATMNKREKLVDPKVVAGEAKRLRTAELYELGITVDSLNGAITTIDSVVSKSDPKSKKDKEINDLTAIVRDIDRGFTATGSYFQGGKRKISKTAKAGKIGKSSKTTKAGKTKIDVGAK